MGKRNASQAELPEIDPDVIAKQGAGSAGQGPSRERKTKFLNNMKALNTQFKAWIVQQATEKPLEPWTDGVKDYISHIEKIQLEFKDVVSETKAAPPASQPLQFSTPTVPSWGAAQPPSAKKEEKAAAMKSMPMPTFSLAPGLLTTPTTPAMPKPAEGFTPALNFGGTPSLFPAMTPPPLSFNTPVTGAGAAEAEEEAEPDSPTQVQRSDEEILFDVKGILYHKEATGWDKKAVGLVSLRKPAASESDAGPPKVRVCVHTMNHVGLLFNSALYKELKVTQTGKAVALSLFFYEEEKQDAQGNTLPQEVVNKMCMFRFGKDESAALFKSLIEKHK